MYTISTQLAKAVFNIGDFFYKDNPIESVKIENGIITYTVGKSSFDKPVDSFFFMCKDWAITNDWILLSTKFEKSGFCRIDKLNGGMSIHRVITNSEQQAIFDACQWLIDIKGV